MFNRVLPVALWTFHFPLESEHFYIWRPSTFDLNRWQKLNIIPCSTIDEVRNVLLSSSSTHMQL